MTHCIHVNDVWVDKTYLNVATAKDAPKDISVLERCLVDEYV